MHCIDDIMFGVEDDVREFDFFTVSTRRKTMILFQKFIVNLIT
jgi:hypothetical protein